MVMETSIARFVDLETEIHDLAERLRPSVVAVRNGNGDGGAGVLWSKELVITNHHVVHEDACRIVLANGQTVEGRVIARDGDNDLTAVRVDVPDTVEVQPINVQPAKGLQIGQLVVAIGHPMGVEWAVTVGALSRIPGPEDRRRVLRASITLLPGNSGGPLVDATGALIGINTMVSGPAEAIAVPYDVVAEFVVSVVAHSPGLKMQATPRD